MKTQRFLIATEGTFDGRKISSDAIRAVLANFISGCVTIPVVYDFYDWSPALSEVVALAVDCDGKKMHLYAEVYATEELQQMAERHVDYFLAPAILSINECDTASRLVSVGLTKDPLIPGLDKLQFSRANHSYRSFFEPKSDCGICRQREINAGKEKHLARYYHHGAHAGNVRYEVEGWGMNSLAREAEIKRRLDEFISNLQVD